MSKKKQALLFALTLTIAILIVGVQEWRKEDPAENITITEEEEQPDKPDEPIEEQDDEEEVLTEYIGQFKVTAYCACEKCCGKWADGITYSGAKATANRTIAVDPSVIPLGTKVLLNGQIYVAEDIGGAIKGNRIDIYFDTHEQALAFGVQQCDVSIVRI